MPESGVPHRGGTQAPHHHHFRVNKNGFQVIHLTKMQKEKTETSSLTPSESSARPSPSIVLSLISGWEKEIRRAGPGLPGPAHCWSFFSVRKILLGLDLGGEVSED